MGLYAQARTFGGYYPTLQQPRQQPRMAMPRPRVPYNTNRFTPTVRQSGINPFLGQPAPTNNAGLNPIMAMMLLSIRQMVNYVQELEGNAQTSTTTSTSGGQSTTTGSSTTSTNTTTTQTTDDASSIVDGVATTTFNGSHTVTGLAEKHVLDMSNGTQKVTVDGQNNVVFAIKNEGANTYEIDGKNNDLIIETLDADDKIILDDDATSYSMEITDSGTVKLRNQNNSNCIEFSVDPELVDPNDERETLKNVLSNIETPDGKTFWDVVKDKSFNPDVNRTTVTKDIGKDRQDKKINDIDGNNTHFILNDVKAGRLSKGRQDNIYNLTGHQNIYEVKGDHGANRFVMNNSASKLTIDAFGDDDSLQFISPDHVQITEEKETEDGWEIKMVDTATGSEVTVKTHNKDWDADFVKERMGEINEEDGLSNAREKRSKRNRIIKIVVGTVLAAASVISFGSTGVAAGAVLGSAAAGAVGITATGLAASAIGSAIIAGVNFGVGKLLPENPAQQIGELGAQLGGRPEWLAERLETENLTGN